MIILAILIALVIGAGVTALLAWLLSVGVPLVIADPSNFWAWLIIVLAAFISLAATRASAS